MHFVFFSLPFIQSFVASRLTYSHPTPPHPTPHPPTIMDPGRGRRERAPKKGAAALAQLAALRRGGGGDAGDAAAAPPKRLDTFELKDEGDVYDVVTEEEYADLVSKRRREGGEPVWEGR